MSEVQYRVYLKEYKRWDQMWENKPHLTFGLYTIITLILFFGGMFGLIFANCPTVILILYLVGICAVCVILAVYRNEMCNMSKSTAFVEKNGDLFSIKLGYISANEINYQAMGNAMNIAVFGFETAHDINIAEQVQRAEKEVRERRKYAEVYVQILEKYLETGKLPDGTVEIIHLVNPKIEKRNNWLLRISYQKGDARATKIYRNAYTLDFSEKENGR